MIATNELRFVEREITMYEQHFDREPTTIKKTTRILQQKWIRPVDEQTTLATIGNVTEEWRDVPVVQEQSNG